LAARHQGRERKGARAVVADLRGRRVAVQFSTLPQSLLATVDGVETVTVLSPEEGAA
jgi:hypothetical protein